MLFRRQLPCYGFLLALPLMILAAPSLSPSNTTSSATSHQNTTRLGLPDAIPDYFTVIHTQLIGTSLEDQAVYDAFIVAQHELAGYAYEDDLPNFFQDFSDRNNQVRVRVSQARHTERLKVNEAMWGLYLCLQSIRDTRLRLRPALCELMEDEGPVLGAIRVTRLAQDSPEEGGIVPIASNVSITARSPPNQRNILAEISTTIRNPGNAVGEKRWVFTVLENLLELAASPLPRDEDLENPYEYTSEDQDTVMSLILLDGVDVGSLPGLYRVGIDGWVDLLDTVRSSGQWTESRFYIRYKGLNIFNGRLRAV